MELNTVTAEDIKAFKDAMKANGWSKYVRVDWRKVEGYGFHMTVGWEVNDERAEDGVIRYTHDFAINGRNHVHAPDLRDSGDRHVALGDFYTSQACVGVALANLLRVGDVIKATFNLSNDSESLRNAGMTHDQCHIEVWRKGKLISYMEMRDAIVPQGRPLAGMIDYSYRADREGAAV